jgi:hypothetical protein
MTLSLVWEKSLDIFILIPCFSIQKSDEHLEFLRKSQSLMTDAVFVRNQRNPWEFTMAQRLGGDNSSSGDCQVGLERPDFGQ